MSKRLLRSTALVGAMTFVSRILGFLRDMIVARVFGADGGTDAFFVAFKIPNLLRRMFAEGAFSQAFVPVLSEYHTRGATDEVRPLVARVAGTLAPVVLLVTLLGVIGAPLLILLFAPGFAGDQAKFDLSADLLRITFPYLLFIALTALASGVLNTFGRFAVPAFTPVFLNLSMIACALWLAPWFDQPVTALAWGVFLGGVAQLLFQLPWLWRMNLLLRPRWGWRDAGVRRILKLMLPAVFGVSVAQINLLLGTVVASFLAAGSVSWLYYSDRLVEFPLGVFGVALATVILPGLSQQHAQAAPQDFSRTLDWALRWVLVISTPAMLGLVLLSRPLICTLFQYGAFTVHDLNMSALSLMAYAAGLPAFIAVKVLAAGFFARQDTRTPVRIGVVSLLANMVLSVVLAVPMVVFGVEGPHAALALAAALAGFVNAGLLWLTLRRTQVWQPRPGWQRLMFGVACAALAMSALLAWGVPESSQWVRWSASVRAAQVSLWVVAGAAVYFTVLRLVGVRWKALLHQTG